MINETFVKLHSPFLYSYIVSLLMTKLQLNQTSIELNSDFTYIKKLEWRKNKVQSTVDDDCLVLNSKLL